MNEALHQKVAENQAPGRPRDPDIDKRVVEAARAILAEEGFSSTTILSVSRRAQIRTASIYRRWPSRIELIEEAIFPGLDDLAVQPTGDLKTDLENFVQAYREVFSTPVARAAVPGLIAEYHASNVSGGKRKYAWKSARPQFRALIAAAPAGSVDPLLDPDDVFDMLVGAVIYKVHAQTLGTRTDVPDQTVELLLRTLRP